MIKLQAPPSFLARLMLAFIFSVEGWSKIRYCEGKVQYMETMAYRDCFCRSSS